MSLYNDLQDHKGPYKEITREMSQGVGVYEQLQHATASHVQQPSGSLKRTFGPDVTFTQTRAANTAEPEVDTVQAIYISAADLKPNFENHE